MQHIPPLSPPRPGFSPSVREFLTANRTPFNADLIDEFLAEWPNVEIQINVRTDIGTAHTYKRPDGKQSRYRLDGSVKFWNIRHPKNAMEVPEWDTLPDLDWDLAKYVQEVGTTWFAQNGSLRLGYDIDTLIGHKEGVTAAEIATVERAVQALDYVEVRRSTGGDGRHLYVLLENVVLQNHVEHAALARAVMGQLCLDAGINFPAVVDCYGGNMWFSSRRATDANRGFERLKPATHRLTSDELPSNWREHLPVVERKRSTVVFAPGLDSDLWAELGSANVTTKPDDEHRRILDAYAETKHVLEYLADFGCWRAHTKGLEQVHERLGLRGMFTTKSEGTDPTSPNCYFFLRPNGSLYVVRYKSQQEDWPHSTKTGEKATYFNVQLDLESATKAVGGVWAGNYCTCPTQRQAKQLAKMFGFELPDLPSDRHVNFKYRDANTLIAETQQRKGETPDGWAVGYRRLELAIPVDSSGGDTNDLDSVVRHIVTTDKENAGWLMKAEDGNWIAEPKENCRDRIADRFDLKGPALAGAMGWLAANPYLLVNEPFAPEFLPGRRWNKFGAQLAVAPTYGGNHPHFDAILKHVGSGLDQAVAADEWCQRHGVADGAQFLLLWAASRFQDPKQSLPLIYLYSKERDNGKSSFHKSLNLLLKRGCVEGVRMLNEQFNKLMLGAVLVYLDEEKVDGKAAQKIKLYIDSDMISARLMRTDTFMFPNYSGWIACYNFKDGLPVEEGDERVIMVEVPLLHNDDKLPWREVMRPALEAEASDFLGTLLTTEIPPSAGRLRLPVLMTGLKAEVTKYEAPSCNLDELCDRIVDVMTDLKTFRGRSKDLIAQLGDGSWSASRNHFRRYVRDIEPRLNSQGISVKFLDERTLCLEYGPSP